MKTKKLYSILIAFLFVTTSAYSQSVKSDYDRDVDFTKYKTIQFAGWSKDSDKLLNDFDKERIENAFKSELQARGIEVVESGADATTTLYLVLEDKTSTTAYTDYMGTMGMRPRWGWGMGAGMGTATTTYQESDYTEGTLVVDMFDGESSNQIWQGILDTEVKSNPKKREKSIPKKISKLMKDFPVDPVK